MSEEDDCNQSDGDMKDGGVHPVAHEEYESVSGLKEIFYSAWCLSV